MFCRARHSAARVRDNGANGWRRQRNVMMNRDDNAGAPSTDRQARYPRYKNAPTAEGDLALITPWGDTRPEFHECDSSRSG